MKYEWFNTKSEESQEQLRKIVPEVHEGDPIPKEGLSSITKKNDTETSVADAKIQNKMAEDYEIRKEDGVLLRAYRDAYPQISGFLSEFSDFQNSYYNALYLEPVEVKDEAIENIEKEVVRITQNLYKIKDIKISKESAGQILARHWRMLKQRFTLEKTLKASPEKIKGFELSQN